MEEGLEVLVAVTLLAIRGSAPKPGKVWVRSRTVRAAQRKKTTRNARWIDKQPPKTTSPDPLVVFENRVRLGTGRTNLLGKGEFEVVFETLKFRNFCHRDVRVIITHLPH